MPDYVIREYLMEDVPALGELWIKTFGDTEKAVREFFRRLPDMGSGLAAVSEGKVVGSAYVIMGMELLQGEKRRSVCGYIYAVAVDEACRGLGIGGELVRKAKALAYERGAEIVCTLPAEESLYKWYEESAGLHCALRRERRTVESRAVKPCAKLSAAEYMLLRERLLRGRTHMRPSASMLEFTSILCREYGGGLYACGGGIAAVYKDGERAVITELICADESGRDAAAASIGAHLGLKDVIYCLPSPDGEPFIAAAPGDIPADCIWGLALSEGEEIRAF